MKIDLSNKNLEKKGLDLAFKKSNSQSYEKSKKQNHREKDFSSMKIDLSKTSKVKRSQPIRTSKINVQKAKKSKTEKAKSENKILPYKEMSSSRIISNITTSFLAVFSFICLMLLIFFKSKNDFETGKIFVVVNFVLILISLIVSILQYFVFSPKHDLEIDDIEEKTNYLPFRKFVLGKIIFSFIAFAVSAGLLVAFNSYSLLMQTSILKGINIIYYTSIGVVLILVLSIFSSTILEMFW